MVGNDEVYGLFFSFSLNELTLIVEYVPINIVAKNTNRQPWEVKRKDEKLHQHQFMAIFRIPFPRQAFLPQTVSSFLVKNYFFLK
jgi:hypothetical protein